VLIRDYLGRLDEAAARLPAHRRAELAAEVRDHIDAALAEAGRSDEVTVRNILERLGSPEEIVAGEAGTAVPPSAAVEVRSGWGAMEIAGLLLIGLAWPALLLPLPGPLGVVLWLGFGVVGLVFVMASSVWSRRQKVVMAVLVVGLYVLFFVLTFPASQLCSGPGETPHPCEPGGPTPVVTTE
jgi:uncharacterized membrane protein